MNETYHTGAAGNFDKTDKKEKCLRSIACRGKTAAAVLLKLFIFNNKRSHTTDVLLCMSETLFSNVNIIQSIIPEEQNNITTQRLRTRTRPCTRSPPSPRGWCTRGRGCRDSCRSRTGGRAGTGGRGTDRSTRRSPSCQDDNSHSVDSAW